MKNPLFRIIIGSTIIFSWNRVDRTVWENIKFNFLGLFMPLGYLIKEECADDERYLAMLNY